MVKSAEKILRNKKGETIIESVVSLLIFTIFMTAITILIYTSIGINRHSIEQYEQLRNIIAEAVKEESYTINNKAITFKIDGDNTESSQTIYGTNNGGIIAFAPKG